VTGKQAAAEAPAPAREAGDEKHATVTTDAVRAIISAGIPVSILDARTGRYDDGRRLPKAKALSAEASAREAARHIPSKNSLVITYCSNTQCPASAHLAKRLRDLGYTNVIEYPAGIAGWEKAGHEIHTVN
jgi:rhodanese-related sulfurtransferase